MDLGGGGVAQEELLVRMLGDDGELIMPGEFLPPAERFDSPRPSIDLDQAGRLAERLAGLGCGFALDDFGTGYGSFTYLKHLPVSYIKIDMEFVRTLRADSPDRQVVSAIVDVARNFGIETIAEGGEAEETAGLLGTLGVDYAQGYHFGRPAPIA